MQEEKRDTPIGVGPTGMNIHHRWALLLCLRTDNDSVPNMTTLNSYLKRGRTENSKDRMTPNVI